MSERPKQALLYGLAALICLEAVGLAVGAVYLVIEIITVKSTSIASAVALAVFAAIFSACLFFVARATLRARPWIRGASIAWQIIQVLVAYSIVQAGGAASGVLFWVLLVPAVAIIVLLFTPQVMRLTSRSPES